MPNWCYSEYYFHGSSADLSVLRNTILRAMSNNKTIRKKDKEWIGGMLYEVDEQSKIADASIDCRGTIDNVSEIVQSPNNSNHKLNVNTQTAYTYIPELWEIVLNKLGLDDVKFSFYAEESTEDLYVIYDPEHFGDFENNYVVDFETELKEGREYLTESGAIDLLQFLLGSNLDDIDELTELAEELEDGYINVSKVLEIDKYERKTIQNTMSPPPKDKFDKYRQKYPVGTVIQLVHMNDPQAPPKRTKGTVKGIDDMGDLLVGWETGGSLKVLLNVDKVKIISLPEDKKGSDE